MESLYRIIVVGLVIASVTSMALGLVSIRDRAPHCFVGAGMFVAGGAMLVCAGFLI